MSNRNYSTCYQAFDDYTQSDTNAVDVNIDTEDLSPDNPRLIPPPAIHVATNKGKWNHVEDLDSFFTKIYEYHQNSGFACMIIQKAGESLQFVFVVIFSLFIFNFVDYDILFHNKVVPGKGLSPDSTRPNSSWVIGKTTLSDCIFPYEYGYNNISSIEWVLVVVACIFLIGRLMYNCKELFYYYEIKKFFNNALNIEDPELINVTWEEVQRKILEVQKEQHMCIHKDALTELDIYQRILRFENYFVAMLNKGTFSLKFNVPFFGDMVFLTRGLRTAIDFVLFWGPWAAFKNNWHIKDDFKSHDKRIEVANCLSSKILQIGLFILLFSPIILIYQIMHSFYHYADIIKKEPGALGMRRWSHYAEVYVRHYNELDHELKARLCRAYRPANTYMNSFSSPLATVLLRPVMFISGSILAVIVVLTLYDFDVMEIEHIVLISAVLGGTVAVTKGLIPDEYMVWLPELLMQRILSEIHYLPQSWLGKAHTSCVRKQFSQLFQYKFSHIIEELFSPLITPFILICVIRRRSLEIVDFFRNFSLELTGVGDICSYALMDIKKHGNPLWHPNVSELIRKDSDYNMNNPNSDNGRTERSLLHFTLTNPNWQPPTIETNFLTAFKTQASKDLVNMSTVPEENCLYNSVCTVSGGLDGPCLNQSMARPTWVPGTLSTVQTSYIRQGGVNRMEGPSNAGTKGILSSIMQQSNPLLSGGPCDADGSTSGPIIDPVLAPSTIGHSMMFQGQTGSIVDQVSLLSPNQQTPQDLMTYQMRLSMVYLNNLYQRNVYKSTYREVPEQLPYSRPGFQGNLPQHPTNPSEDNSFTVSYNSVEDTPLIDKL